MKGLVVPSTLILEGVASAAIAGSLLLAATIRLVLRTRRLPICWHCAAEGVRRSHSRNFLDELARAVLLYPYRCEKCLQRFYCFRSRRVPRHRARTSAAGGGQ